MTDKRCTRYSSIPTFLQLHLSFSPGAPGGWLVFYHRILKCHALVEYATASMDNHLFVSKYAVQLPSKTEMSKTQNNLVNGASDQLGLS